MFYSAFHARLDTTSCTVLIADLHSVAVSAFLPDLWVTMT